MEVALQSNSVTVPLPASPQDIHLGRYLNAMAIMESNLAVAEYLDTGVIPKGKVKQTLVAMKDTVEAFCGAEKDSLIGANLDALTRALMYLVGLVYEAEADAKDATEDLRDTDTYAFTWEGKHYHTGAINLTGTTIIEIMEAATYSTAIEEVQNKEWRSMIKVMAVLLRPDNKAYSEALYEEQLVEFERLPLDYAFRAAFFFAASLTDSLTGILMFLGSRVKSQA